MHWSLIVDQNNITDKVEINLQENYAYQAQKEQEQEWLPQHNEINVIKENIV